MESAGRSSAAAGLSKGGRACMVDLYSGDRAGGMDRLRDARQAVDVPIAVDPELARCPARPSGRTAVPSTMISPGPADCS